MKPYPLILCLMIFLMPMSCEEEVSYDYGLMGHSPLIQLSQDEFQFSDRGGTASVMCKNYPKCRITNLRDCNSGNYFFPEKDENWNPLYIEGNGIVVRTVDNTTISITVAESASASHWVLTVSTGDVFAKVQIRQM